jgi:hypothetical protein
MITRNVIIWFYVDQNDQIGQLQVSLNKRVFIAYCYHLINVISLSISKLNEFHCNNNNSIKSYLH